MSLSLLTDPRAVRSAMQEYDELGGDQFLSRYGYRPARSYVIVESGKEYPSKAIAGVAVGKQHPGRGPLRSDEFSGGESTVHTKLKELGFIVRAPVGSSSQPATAPASDRYWFVGASFRGKDDQTERFLRDKLWEINAPSASEAAQVLSMKPGERIAIKAAFVQKHDLPFDNRGNRVSVLRIKARGVIRDNPGDGVHVLVDWEESFTPRDWYFYTYRPTIWQVSSGNELADRLIAFTFADQPQDIEWFRKREYWSSRFGDPATSSQRFWIEKTNVTGREDRRSGEHALAKALWSPHRAKDGKNIYANMLQVRDGDVIFHLIDNQAIAHVSLAAGPADANFTGLEGTDWAGQPAYRVPLRDCQKLQPPLSREAFLETEPFASELKELAESGAKGLFYNGRRGLNQGVYLTEMTPTLLSILNRAYVAQTGRNLPYVEVER